MARSSASSYSGSSRSSSRSSSASSSRSGSSNKSRSSRVSHSNIKSNSWVVAFMKWTTGAPLGRPLSLRRTEVQYDDWDYDDVASTFSNSYSKSYAWVAPRFDDSISIIAGRSSSRSSRRCRREHRPRTPSRFPPPPPAMHQPPPPFGHNPFPPQPQFMPSPPTFHDEHGYEDRDDGEGDYDGYEPWPAFHHVPSPPPPMGGGGAAPFIDISAGGGGGGGSRKYEDWSD